MTSSCYLCRCFFLWVNFPLEGVILGNIPSKSHTNSEKIHLAVPLLTQCLLVRSREASKAVKFRFSIFQSLWYFTGRQNHCRVACQIPKRYKGRNIQFRGIETWRGRTIVDKTFYPTVNNALRPLSLTWIPAWISNYIHYEMLGCNYSSIYKL